MTARFREGYFIDDGTKSFIRWPEKQNEQNWSSKSYLLFNNQYSKMGNRVSLEDEMVNLRIVSKQMQRSSKKCEKNEKAALEKLKKVRDFAFWDL